MDAFTVRVLAIMGAMLLVAMTSEAASTEHPDPADSRTPEAAFADLPPTSATEEPATLLEPVRSIDQPLLLGRTQESEGWFRRFWREHRYHILTVFLLEQADHIYEEKVGPPDTPRFFGSPSGLDKHVQERFPTPSNSSNFIVSNKSVIFQLLSTGAIVWANGHDAEGIADDVMGLLEAHKINWASSSLVKNIVGRRRPPLEAAVASGDREAIDRSGPSGRNSFYSDAASKAFAYAAYTDSVLARRFGDNRMPRIWSAIGLYGLASYVAYTRIEEGKHYLSDVIVGAGAGLAVGKIVHAMHHRKRDHDEVSVRLQPILVPGGAGITLTVAR